MEDIKSFALIGSAVKDFTLIENDVNEVGKVMDNLVAEDSDELTELASMMLIKLASLQIDVESMRRNFKDFLVAKGIGEN